MFKFLRGIFAPLIVALAVFAIPATASAGTCDLSGFSGGQFGIADAQLAQAIAGARDLGLDDCLISQILSSNSGLAALPVKAVDADPGDDMFDQSRGVALLQYTNQTGQGSVPKLQKIYKSYLGANMWTIERTVRWTFNGQQVVSWEAHDRPDCCGAFKAPGWSYAGAIDTQDHYFKAIGADGLLHSHGGVATYRQYKLTYTNPLLPLSSKDYIFALARNFMATGHWVAVASASTYVPPPDDEGPAPQDPAPPTPPAAPAPPSNTALPTVSFSVSKPFVGETATATSGTWTGYLASLGYQWYRCSGSCTSIDGETGYAHIVSTDDIGYTLKVAVTASDGSSSVSATSAQTTAISGTDSSTGSGMVAFSFGPLQTRTYAVSSADHKIHEAGWNPGVGWSWGPALSSEVAAGSQLAGFNFGNGMARIYFVSAADSKIYQVSYNPDSGWAQSSALTDAVRPGPLTAFNYNNGAARIYYVLQSDNRVHELSYNTWSGWANSNALTEEVAFGSSISGFNFGNQRARIYYVALNDSKVHELSYNPGLGWAQGGALTQAVAPGGLATFNFGGGSMRGYYAAASDHAIHEFRYVPGSGWTDSAALSPAVATGSAIQGFNYGADRSRVYAVMASDKKVHELSWNPSVGWANGPAISSVVKPAALAAFDQGGGQARVYAIDAADSMVHEAGYATATGWTWSTSLSDALFGGGIPPMVTCFTPLVGRDVGGTTVTITGTGFTGVTGVKFGTVPATSYTVNSSTQITATAPAQASGVVDIAVSTADGPSYRGPCGRYTYAPRPQLHAITSPGGAIDILWKGADNRLWDLRKAAGGAWGTAAPVGPLGSPAGTGIEPVVESNGKIHVFTKGDDNRLYEQVYTPGSGWASGFTPIGSVGSPVGTGLAPIIDSAGKIHVFSKGDDSRAYEQVYTPGSGWASGFTPIGPATSPVGTNLVPILDSAGKIHLFQKGDDSRLYEQVYTAGSGWASGFAPIGSVGSPVGTGVVPFLDSAGKIHVFSKGNDSRAYEQVYTPGTGWASGFTPIGAVGSPLGTGIEPVLDAAGKIHLLNKGDNGGLYEQVYTAGTGWASGFARISTFTLDGSVEAVAGTDGALYALTVNNDGKVYVETRSTGASPAWTTSMTAVTTPYAP